MKVNFKTPDSLIPVIIQNNYTMQVLMLGYMNEEALNKTQIEKKVTFFSRSKNRLWTKGENSGNFLYVNDILIDCDQDALLIKVTPEGPTCHTGALSCFGQYNFKGFLYELQHIIEQRIKTNDELSYTNTLFKKGVNKVAQKLGEEAIELIIESKDTDEHLFRNESADLLYHFLLLLKIKKTTLEDIEKVLYLRNKK